MSQNDHDDRKVVRCKQHISDEQDDHPFCWVTPSGEHVSVMDAAVLPLESHPYYIHYRESDEPED